MADRTWLRKVQVSNFRKFGEFRRLEYLLRGRVGSLGLLVLAAKGLLLRWAPTGVKILMFSIILPVIETCKRPPFPLLSLTIPFKQLNFLLSYPRGRVVWGGFAHPGWGR